MAIVECYNCGRCEYSIDTMHRTSDGRLLCESCYREEMNPFRSTHRGRKCPKCNGTGEDFYGAPCDRCWGNKWIEDDD